MSKNKPFFNSLNIISGPQQNKKTPWFSKPFSIPGKSIRNIMPFTFISKTKHCSIKFTISSKTLSL